MFRVIRLIALSVSLIALLTLAITGCSSTEVRYSPNNSSSDTAAPKITSITQTNSPMPESYIEFDIPQAGGVYFEVTTATGYHVRTLLDDEIEAGRHAVTWDGTNDDGDQIDPGIYLYHLTASGHSYWTPFAFAISIDDAGGE